MSEASSAMVSAVLSQHLADMPKLRSLQLDMETYSHLAAVALALSTSTQLETLRLECCRGLVGSEVLTEPLVRAPLHLASLQHFHLDLEEETARALNLPNLLAQLSTEHAPHMQRLQSLSWVMMEWHSAEDCSVAQLLVDALRSLPKLTNLTIGNWCCETVAVWQDLPGRLAGLPGLTRLVLKNFLAAFDRLSWSAPWTQSLSSAIRQLTGLQDLCIRGDDDSSDEEEDLVSDSVAAASQQLTAAIGSLPQLLQLELYHVPCDVDLRH
jgi:hypothetical protein